METRARETGSGAAMLGILLLAVFFAAQTRAEGLRLEGAIGACQAKPIEEGKWWIDVGGTNVSTTPMRAPCYQFGLSQIHQSGVGVRVSFVDLGRMPLGERAWSTYGPQPHWTATGDGRANGLSFGPILEQRLFEKLNFTVEGGLFGYRSYWQAVCAHNASGKSVHVAPGVTWNATWYAGAGLSYQMTKKLSVIANLRLYDDIHAATLGDNGDVIGPKSASIWQVTAGISVAI